jgi:hypothetical protein
MLTLGLRREARQRQQSTFLKQQYRESSCDLVNYLCSQEALNIEMSIWLTRLQMTTLRQIMHRAKEDKDCMGLENDLHTTNLSRV